MYLPELKLPNGKHWGLLELIFWKKVLWNAFKNLIYANLLPTYSFFVGKKCFRNEISRCLHNYLCIFVWALRKTLNGRENFLFYD